MTASHADLQRRSVSSDGGTPPAPPPAKALHVTQFLRGPSAGGFSLEQMFADIRPLLPSDIQVEVVVNPYPNSGLLPRLRAARHARRFGGEVNHVLGDQHFLGWFLPRANSILTVHDCVSLERLGGWRRAVVWLLWYWWPLKRAGWLTVVSQFTRQTLLSWVRFPAERITIIPPPLSDDFKPVPARPFARWRNLLTVGTAPNKNLARIIEAVAGLDVHLIMIGHLPDDILTLLKAHRVSFENPRDLKREQLVALYAQADVLVFASTYEGFGIPIVEAQAVGRPVITSDVGPMPETSGGEACLVDPFSVESIRKAVQKVLADEDYAMNLIEAGRANALRYRPQAIADRYAQLYRIVSKDAAHAR